MNGQKLKEEKGYLIEIVGYTDSHIIINVPEKYKFTGGLKEYPLGMISNISIDKVHNDGYCGVLKAERCKNCFLDINAIDGCKEVEIIVKHDKNND